MRTLRLTRANALTRTLGAGVLGGVLAASGVPYLPSDATAYLTLAGSEYHVNASDLQYQTSAGPPIELVTEDGALFQTADGVYFGVTE